MLVLTKIVQQMVKGFDEVEWRNIPREENQEADALASKYLTGGKEGEENMRTTYRPNLFAYSKVTIDGISIISSTSIASVWADDVSMIDAHFLLSLPSGRDVLSRSDRALTWGLDHYVTDPFNDDIDDCIIMKKSM